MVDEFWDKLNPLIFQSTTTFIQYHDPNNNWPTFKGILRFQQSSPRSTEQRA